MTCQSSVIITFQRFFARVCLRPVDKSGFVIDKKNSTNSHSDIEINRSKEVLQNNLSVGTNKLEKADP